jgi:peptide chain release factor 3
VNWPIGAGAGFRGVYDRQTKQVHLFERTVGGQFRAPVSIGSFSESVIRSRLDDATFQQVTEELSMLDLAGEEFDEAAVLAGRTTPVFFGSGINNFGVALLLAGFLKYSPPPKPRFMAGTPVAPEHPAFSGFIFKIQANMDPKHRDRIAFLRVCTGHFERDMTVIHPRINKRVRLSSSHKLFGHERETLNEAFPGDIVGLVGHSDFGIGDTLTTDPAIAYQEIPRFTPEAFAFLHNPNTARFKQFRRGLEQLLQEGVIQTLHLRRSPSKVPLLAAVGPLQFEVVQFRLESEYGAASRLESASWSVLRWLPPHFKESDLDALPLPTGARLAYDMNHHPVILFPSEWSANYFSQSQPHVSLSALPPTRPETVPN